jgi:Xaa-Pro aminopeptidase
MIPVAHHVARRRELLGRLERPALLFAGGEIARNGPFNCYPDRADSNFLLFFPPLEPDACALFDPDDGTVTLFLHERTEVDALWMGPRPSFAELRERLAVDEVLPVERLEATVDARRRGRGVDAVAVSDARSTERARLVTGQPLDFFEPERIAAPSLRDALAALRMRKSPPEVAEMRRAAAITADAFREALAATRPGVPERELAALVDGTFARQGAVPGYPTILSVRGEVLHNHGHDGTLADGDLLLVDAGAEVESGWCADVTRTWPVGGRFGPEQRAVYEAVLAGQKAAIDRARRGVRWRDVHLAATRVIAEGLVEIGLLRGSADVAVERGAAAVFFPHGVGHLLGLDVHDLRTFGDAVLYAPGRTRSTEPGLSFLRMDLDLGEGMVVTVEPGVYFVPAMLRSRERRERLGDVVDFDRAERFLAAGAGRGFGGVRIEDDVLVTAGAPEILTPGVPKEIADVEAAIGAGRAATAR